MAKQATKMKKTAKVAAKPAAKSQIQSKTVAPSASSNPTPNELASLNATAQDSPSFLDKLFSWFSPYKVKGSQEAPTSTKTEQQNSAYRKAMQRALSQLNLYSQEFDDTPNIDKEAKAKMPQYEQWLSDKQRSSGYMFDGDNALAMMKQIGYKADKNLPKDMQIALFNDWLTKQKSLGMDPMAVRNEWGDPRAVADFLKTAAEAAGGFTTPEQLIWTGRGSNKTYSGRNSQVQLLPTGSSSIK
jgi:hypothetical protein|nr:MAG TPA: hypothetical protein [Caudoviricetes sp.]